MALQTYADYFGRPQPVNPVETALSVLATVGKLSSMKKTSELEERSTKTQEEMAQLEKSKFEHEKAKEEAAQESEREKTIIDRLQNVSDMYTTALMKAPDDYEQAKEYMKRILPPISVAADRMFPQGSLPPELEQRLSAALSLNKKYETDYTPEDHAFVMSYKKRMMEIAQKASGKGRTGVVVPPGSALVEETTGRQLYLNPTSPATSVLGYAREARQVRGQLANFINIRQKIVRANDPTAIELIAKLAGLSEAPKSQDDIEKARKEALKEIDRLIAAARTQLSQIDQAYQNAQYAEEPEGSEEVPAPATEPTPNLGGLFGSDFLATLQRNAAQEQQRTATSKPGQEEQRTPAMPPPVWIRSKGKSALGAQGTW